MKNIPRIAQNSILSFLMNVSLKAANVIVFILISRKTGVEQAGIFSLSTIYLLVLSAMLIGLDELIVRQVARDHCQAKQIFSSYLFLRLILSGILYVCFYLIIVFAMKYPENTRNACLIIGFCLIPDGISGTGQALLAGYERFGVSFFSAILSGTVKVAGALFFLGGENSVIMVGYIWLAGSWLAAMIVFVTAVYQVGGIRIPKRVESLISSQEVRMSVPFLLISLVSILEFQVDVFMLSKMQGEFALGLYSAVTTITSSLILISQAYRAAVYPVMIRLYKASAFSLMRVYQLSMFGLGLLVLPMAIGLILLGPRIVVWIYSPQFTASGTTLQIIAIMLVFLFLGVPNWRMLFILEKQRTIASLWLVSLVVNFSLNWLLVPELSIRGAAISRVISEFVSFISGYIIASRLVGYTRSFRDLLFPGVAAVSMGAVVWLFRDQALWMPILIGVIVYPLFLLGFSWLSPQDRRLYGDIWKIAKKIFTPLKGNFDVVNFEG